MTGQQFEYSDEIDPLSEPGTLSLFASDAQRRQALDQMFTVAYEELKRLATLLKYHDGSATLNPTALVGEAWLTLARSSGLRFESHLHFKRIAARAMRHILAEAARQRSAQKRPGIADALFVELDELAEPVSCDSQFLALHEALNELQKVDPRQAMMVECKYFGGFNVPELVAILGVSEATILRDWRAAKAWLAAEICRKPGHIG